MKKMMTGFMQSAVISLAFVMSGVAVAQPIRSQPIELSCVHLYPIQMKYFEKHITYNDETPELEKRTIEQFIKKLDGSKLYLLEKDVATLDKALNGIFKKVQKKDCSEIEKAEDIYLQRVKERVEYAKQYLGPKFKFNPKTSIVLDPEHRSRPKTKAEANAFHNKYIQYQVATYIASGSKLDEARGQVVRNYERSLKRLEALPKSDLWTMYLDSFSRSLDPHSSYLSADALEDFEISMRLRLEGIGATLSSKDGFTVIEQLIPGGAANLSGKLKNKDKILAVAQGDSDEFTNVIEMDLRDVVRLIRGPKGSKLRLKILRKVGSETQRFEVALVRDTIKLDDEAASITYLDREVNGQKKKIGLVNLPSFYADSRRDGPSSSGDLKKLLAEAKAKNVDGIVLDLSSNGGGSLSDAVKIAGEFFARGNVVKQSQRPESDNQQIQYEVLRDIDDRVDFNGPLVILASRISASASEIVSGTLQDYHRAVIVGGDHTFGKGSVQSVEYLPPGLGAIKTTVGMFFTAGGQSTQHRGVTADVPMPSVFSTDEIGEKTLDYSLKPKSIEPFLSKEAYVTEGASAWKVITPDVIAKLKKKSEVRVATAEGFKKVREDIKKAQKHEHAVVVGELIKEKEEQKNSPKNNAKKDLAKAKDSGTTAVATGDDDDDGDINLSPEERKKKYMERADIQEAVNIVGDLISELDHAPLRVGAKDDASDGKGSEKPN
jgi:carboxyl-terminal processing protease